MTIHQHVYGDIRTSVREIRVLSILPGSPSQPIEITLRVVDLDDEPGPKYQTLSYVWGILDNNSPNFVVVDGSNFRVTPNLYNALHELRVEDAARTFWVDAICINQSNIPERDSQVQLMKDIYQKSARTIVWLGKSSPDTPDVFAFLGEIYGKREWRSADELSRIDAEKARLVDLLRNDLAKQEIVKNGFWQDLALRPFWERTWIVQEVSMSKNVTVRCGSNTMEWEQFADAIFRLTYATENALPRFFSGIPGVTGLEWIDEIRRIFGESHEISIGDMIAALRSFHATDPRDKIYGVLGMTRNTSIRPDYEGATMDNLYTDAVDSCLKSEGNLDLITMRRFSIPGSNLASWVPDLRPAQLASDQPPIPRAHPLCLKWISGNLLRAVIAPRADLPRKNTEDDSVVDLTPWSAHMNIKATDAVIQRDPTMLTARGKQIGIVEAVGDIYQPGDTTSPTHFYPVFLNWESLMLQKFGNCTSPGGTEKLSDVFDRCLTIWDQYDKRVTRTGRQDPLPWIASERKSYVEGGSIIEAFVKTLNGGRDGSWGRISAKKYTQFWSQDENQSHEWGTELSYLGTAINRRLVILKDGHIGLGLANVKIGDVVYVLYGCSVPVVLRQEGKDRFSFVCDIYVQGLMTGAAMEERNQQRFPEKKVVIQ